MPPLPPNLEELRVAALAQRPWRPSTVSMCLLGLGLEAYVLFYTPATWWGTLGMGALGIFLIAWAGALESRP